MKRLLFLFFIGMLAPLCAAAVVFAPVAFGAATGAGVSVGTQVWAAGGWLWHSDDAAVPVRVAGASGQVSYAQYFLAFDAGCATLESTFPQAEAAARSGFCSLSAGSRRLAMQAGVFCASLPADTRIGEGKPRFSFTDIDANGGWVSLTLAPADSVSIAAGAFAGGISMERGDLYYLYGRVRLPQLVAGDVRITLPYAVTLYAAGVCGDIVVETNDGIGLGDGGLKLYLAYAEKCFPLPTLPVVYGRQTLALAAGYAYAAFDASVSVTSQTQTYAFFPYKFLNAAADGAYRLVFALARYAAQTRRLSLALSAGYGVCVADDSSAECAYRYKKSLFFDGSSGGGDFEMPSFAESAVVAGALELSYRLDVLPHATPVLSVRKLFAVPLLSAQTKAYFSDDDVPAAADDSADDAPAVNWSAVRTALLSGLVLSVRLELR